MPSYLILEDDFKYEKGLDQINIMVTVDSFYNYEIITYY